MASPNSSATGWIPSRTVSAIFFAPAIIFSFSLVDLAHENFTRQKAIQASPLAQKASKAMAPNFAYGEK
jgi:hypothetical protein